MPETKQTDLKDIERVIRSLIALATMRGSKAIPALVMLAKTR